jgi:hypothetical protein
VELTSVNLTQSALYGLDDQLANRHAGTQLDWQGTMIDQLKLDRS